MSDKRVLITIIFGCFLLITITTASSDYCIPTPNNLDTTNITHDGNWWNITIYSDPECWVWMDAGYGDIVGYPCPTHTTSFVSNVTCGVVPFSVQFTDTSIGTNLTSWYWDFADGNTTAQNPVWNYTVAGLYGVDHSSTENATDTTWYNASNYITARAAGDTCAGGDEYDSDDYEGNWFSGWWF